MIGPPRVETARASPREVSSRGAGGGKGCLEPGPGIVRRWPAPGRVDARIAACKNPESPENYVLDNEIEMVMSAKQ
ncbi:hypothetical protein GCM10022221_58750 [Actinocorallia aurea]